jgi:predicted nucleotidyltransferase
MKKVNRPFFVNLAKDFIDEILSQEKWYLRIHNNIDLTLLTGSCVQGNAKPDSDVDLFLFIPKSIAVKEHYPAAKSYDFKDRKFDVSFVCTEKLVHDAESKEKICWYAKAVPIKINQKYKKYFLKAGKMNNEERIEHLWTNYILFAANYSDLKKCLKRKNLVGARILFGDLLRFYSDTILVNRGLYVRPKQYTRIKEFDKKKYARLAIIADAKKIEKQLPYLENMKKDIQTILMKNGFKKNEIENWKEQGIGKIKFLFF